MIYFECDADGILIKTLGFTKKDVFHAGSKGEVCNRLSKVQRSRGLVDEDPGDTQPTYIKNLQRPDPENFIRILRGPKENAVIMLCPRLEEWALRAAQEVKVDPLDFNLPKDPDELHKIGNLSIKNLEKFVREIESKKSPMFKALKKILS